MIATVLMIHALAVTAAVDKVPNIIVVMTDDQGYGELGFHGNKIIKTPNLDRFAGESFRFRDFHVSPTCAPTRTSIMTGRHEFRSGVTHTIQERERMSLKAFTLAQLLKSAGYTTGIFGKWHLGDEDAYQPGKRGFDEVFIHGCGGIGQTYPGSCGDAPKNTYFDPYIRHNGTFEKTKGYCTDVFFGQAMKWIEAKKSGPFFAFITPNAPHGPYISPADTEKLYANTKLTKQEQAYYGMITNIDINFGLLLAKLKELGLEENTLIIFMTDNGHAVGSVYNAGMRGTKGTAYQGGTRVPGLWRWPAGFKGNVDCTHLAAHLDMFPTFAEITGAKIPTGIQLDGRSLLPALKDPKCEWKDRHVFTHVGRWPKGKVEEHKFDKCSIRTQQFRFVNNKELFDISKDPGETTNVIDQHPEVVKGLRAAYEQWWSEILPALENENVVGPMVNPYHVAFWKQFGGGPKKD